MPARTFWRNVSHEKGLQPIPTNPKDARYAEVPIMIRFFFCRRMKRMKRIFPYSAPPFRRNESPPLGGMGGLLLCSLYTSTIFRPFLR